jgi:hypothetical protein
MEADSEDARLKRLRRVRQVGDALPPGVLRPGFLRGRLRLGFLRHRLRDGLRDRLLRVTLDGPAAT